MTANASGLFRVLFNSLPIISPDAVITGGKSIDGAPEMNEFMHLVYDDVGTNNSSLPLFPSMLRRVLPIRWLTEDEINVPLQFTKRNDDDDDQIDLLPLQPRYFGIIGRTVASFNSNPNVYLTFFICCLLTISFQQSPIQGRPNRRLLPLLCSSQGRREGNRRCRDRIEGHRPSLRYPSRSCFGRSYSRTRIFPARCRNSSRVDLPRILRCRLHTRW